MGGGKAPMPTTQPAPVTTPKETPEVPTAEKETQAQADAREQQRKAAAAARGKSSTVLTGDTGDESEANTNKTVLGG